MVGADVASMTHTARLSSKNTLVEVQPVESLATAAVSGFAENLWLFMLTILQATGSKLGEGITLVYMTAEEVRHCMLSIPKMLTVLS